MVVYEEDLDAQVGDEEIREEREPVWTEVDIVKVKRLRKLRKEPGEKTVRIASRDSVLSTRSLTPERNGRRSIINRKVLLNLIRSRMATVVWCHGVERACGEE